MKLFLILYFGILKAEDEKLSDIVDGKINTAEAIPYLSVYIEDVLSIMGDKKPEKPAHIESVDLLKLNREWIEKQKNKSADHVKIINTPWTIPITPQVIIFIIYNNYKL